MIWFTFVPDSTGKKVNDTVPVLRGIGYSGEATYLGNSTWRVYFTQPYQNNNYSVMVQGEISGIVQGTLSGVGVAKHAGFIYLTVADGVEWTAVILSQ